MVGKPEPFVELVAVLGPAVVEVRFVAAAVAILVSSWRFLTAHPP